MKKYNTILKLFALFFFFGGMAGCNDDFLQEKPLDFLSPENVFTTKEGFESAIIGLHANLRNKIWGVTDGQKWFVLKGAYGSDYGYEPRNFTGGLRNDYSLITSQDGQASMWWNACYGLIKDANVIITRAGMPPADGISQEDKDVFVGRAKFFRAFAYRILVQLYGGVPIIDEEITGVKLDFVRNTKEEVYQFIIDDLEFASKHIPADPELDGMVSKAAADHLLTEIYICTEQWDKAIEAASRVINNPDYELMTQRFGKYADVATGDPYWDLFRLGNQNRGSGNKEAIFVLQIDWPTPGGGSESHPRWPGHVGERNWCPFIDKLKDPDGKDGIILENTGDPVTTFGRGVAWCRTTHYVNQTIWKEDWNDMRNSEANIQRTFYYNNPSSAYYGQEVTSLFDESDTLLYLYPYFRKVSHPEGYPDDMNNTGRIWRDLYVMRLAETYLLRAEAKLGKGDKDGAADDINIVRARAHATPVDPANVTIDYILDERARELVTEEFRTLTLMRLGKLYERVKKYNPIAGPTIKPYNNLWPIPQSEIDRNFGAELEQNPGY